jgi:F0F1-type ATP synthase membrane subunit c/vacuolar-type H+-ATPase subunit K
MIDSGSFLPAAVALTAGIASFAWCMIRGSTIGASEMVEKKETTGWGQALCVAGFMMMILGVLSSLIFLIPDRMGFFSFIAAEVIFFGAVLIASILGKFGVRPLTLIFLGILGVFPILLFPFSGGGLGVLPTEVWLALFGALTMIGTAICAAVCIATGVKAGSTAMVEKSELSIWSLLFVALGEGLAIYGLIVAILLII